MYVYCSYRKLSIYLYFAGSKLQTQQYQHESVELQKKLIYAMTIEIFIDLQIQQIGPVKKIMSMIRMPMTCQRSCLRVNARPVLAINVKYAARMYIEIVVQHHQQLERKPVTLARYMKEVAEVFWDLT